MKILLLLLGALVGYLFGSLPFAYWVVKSRRRVDLRQFGSRTVSASMVGVLVSKPVAALVGILDIIKAAVPVAVAYRLMPGSLLPGIVGVGAFLGHTWPVWLGFVGGRGISVVIGTLLVIFPLGALLIVLMVGLGYLLRAGAVCVLAGVGLVPIMAGLLHRPAEVVLVTLVLFLLVIAKRLEANREPLPRSGKRAVLVRRLLLDRDIPDWGKWLARQPTKELGDRDSNPD
ncbi:MAG: glycerol-3-phosphate acyltransferase [candidate division WOR-3 bacterium]